MTKENRVYVANAAQKALLDFELLGQISDGHWENSRPMNHWKAWCHSEVVVRPEKTGISFLPVRKYDFAAYELLRIVRTRMILYVRLAARFNAEDVQAAELLFDVFNRESFASEAPELQAEIPTWISQPADRDDAGEYYKTLRDRLVAIISNADDRNYLEKVCALPIKTKEAGVYNLKALMQDLKELNEIQGKRI